MSLQIEKVLFISPLFLWLWMKLMWPDHNENTTTHRITITIYSPVNWIYFYHFAGAKENEQRTTQQKYLMQFKTGDFVILCYWLLNKKHAKFVTVYWLHMTATGDWLREIFPLRNSVAFYLHSSWCQAKDNKMCDAIKLPDNCYLFECNQCAVRFNNNNNHHKKMWNISAMRSSWKSIKIH